MKEFEEYLEDHVIPYENGTKEAQEARELLDKILCTYREEGFEGFFQTLAMLDMIGNTDYFFAAWAAFRLIDLEFIPSLFDSPELLQGFCRSQARINPDLCWN